MAIYEDIKVKVDEIIVKYKASAADGSVTLAEAYEILQLAVHDVMLVVEELSLPGVDKKALVMQAVDKFYDEVIAPLDIKAIPNAVEPLADRLLKTVLLQIVDGAIDALVAILKKGK